MANTILKMNKMNIYFPGVHALNDVDFNLKQGEVRALVGKNGAGKSTLIKIITGIYKATSGEIIFNGKKIEHGNPKSMFENGVVAIYQKNDFVSYFNIAETVMLNHEICTDPLNKFINKKKLHEATAKILNEQLNFEIDTSKLMRDLTVSQQQIVQIAKNLVTLPRLIIFDEPTAALTAREIKKLFEIIRSLKKRGVSIIYISHRFDEVFEIADTITIFRDGKKVADKDISKVTKNEVIGLMVGEASVDLIRTKRAEKEKKEQILKINNFTNEFLQEVSFSLGKGEILGFFGGEGAGQQQLAETIYGMHPNGKGEIELFGKKIVISNPKNAIMNRIGFVPRDRDNEGLVSKYTCAENITLPIIRKISSKIGFIDLAKEQKITMKQIDDLSIMTPGPNTCVHTLSGGNKQKVVLARWITNDPKILILDYPTMGIDVKAKAEVYRILEMLALNGMSIILITPEYEELAILCDRLYIMRDKKIIKEFFPDEFDEHKILEYAIG